MIYTLGFFALTLTLALYLAARIVLRRRRHRRVLTVLARNAGVERMPGETNKALRARVARELRIVPLEGLLGSQARSEERSRPKPR